MSEVMDFTHELLTDKVEKGKSAILPYIAKRHFYEVSDDTVKGRSLVINPELGRYTSQRAHDTPARISTADLVRMEEAMKSIREMQNF